MSDMKPVIRVTQATPTYPWRAPSRSYGDDCGYDLFVSVDTWCAPFSYTDVPHNIKVQLPEFTWGWLTARSSTLRDKGLIVMGGVIDAGYRGELFTQVYNPTDSPIRVSKDDRISQLIVMPLIVPDLIAVDKLDETDRGDKGFGSRDNPGGQPPSVNVEVSKGNRLPPMAEE